MTPEQHEQWQEAIMQAYPAPTPDGHEGTFEQWKNHRIAEAALLSLMPEAEQVTFLKKRVESSVEHLAGWNLPDWTLETRDYCASEFYKPWMPDFLFRANAILIGMNVRYGAPEEQGKPYLRLLTGFFRRLLRPLVEYAETVDNASLRYEYEGYYQICCLCESDDHYLDSQRWLDIQNHFGPSGPGASSRIRAPFLVDALVKRVRRTCFQVDEPGALRSMESLLSYLGAEYKECSLLENRMAQAFLDALEAECPYPDWLPRIEL